MDDKIKQAIEKHQLECRYQNPAVNKLRFSLKEVISIFAAAFLFGGMWFNLHSDLRQLNTDLIGYRNDSIQDNLKVSEFRLFVMKMEGINWSNHVIMPVFDDIVKRPLPLNQ